MRQEGTLKIWQEGEKSVWNWGLPLMTWNWVLAARSLDSRGVALRVGVLAWALKRGLAPHSRAYSIRLGRKHTGWVGVKPDSLPAALERLESAGLIVMKRQPGSMARVFPAHRPTDKNDTWKTPVGLWLPPVCHISRELPPVCLMAYLLMAVRSDRKTLNVEMGRRLTGWVESRKNWSRAIGLLQDTPLVERRGRNDFRLPALLDGGPEFREKLSVGWADEIFRPDPAPAQLDPKPADEPSSRPDPEPVSTR